MMKKLSGFHINFCNFFTSVQYSIHVDRTVSLVFFLHIVSRIRQLGFHSPKNSYVTYTGTLICCLSTYNWSGLLLAEYSKLQGLFKTNYLLLVGYAIAFKKKIYLSGQVNRLRGLKRQKLRLQLGYTSKIKIRGLKQLRFRRWKRKKFGILIRSNQHNYFNAFIDLLRHLRLRGRYTSRGIRLRRDRYKMKLRPDHGKYGFKMNY